MIFLLIICVIVTKMLSWCDTVDFHIKSLGMQYSVITTSEGCSTERVNMQSCLIYSVCDNPVIPWADVFVWNRLDIMLITSSHLPVFRQYRTGPRLGRGWPPHHNRTYTRAPWGSRPRGPLAGTRLAVAGRDASPHCHTHPSAAANTGRHGSHAFALNCIQMRLT